MAFYFPPAVHWLSMSCPCQGSIFKVLVYFTLFERYRYFAIPFFLMSTSNNANAMSYDEDVKDDVTCLEPGTQTPMKSDGTALSVVSAQERHYRVYKRRWAGLVGFVSPNSCSILRREAHVMPSDRTQYCFCNVMAMVWTNF